MIDKITCPNCGHHFDVEDALSGKIQSHYQKEYEKKIEEQNERFRKEKEQLEKEKESFEEKKEKENQLFKEKLEQRLIKEAEKIRQKTHESFEQQLKTLQLDNEKKKEENRNLKAQEINLLRRENELKEKAEELELKVEKQILEKQKEIEEKARIKERESFELEKIKLLKQIEDNKKLAEEMKRKAEQGSMQLQGEVQELALEELLEHSFPFDKVTEVSKGIRGADCIQRVFNSLQQECGSIVYESKRTKHFANDWIDKLKQDQIQCKADLAVIVTETFPKDMLRFGQKEGIWICSFQEVKSLALILREMLIRIKTVQSSEENKGDKMELLYRYLTGSEFAQNVQRIVENYDNMQNQLLKEKRAMHNIWKEREKQIWVVQENLSSLFGSIKGIAGKDLQASSMMELDTPTEKGLDT